MRQLCCAGNCQNPKALCLSSSSNALKFSKLLSIVFSTWFTAAGFIHLVENSGDPWLKGRNSQNLTYFDSIYLVMATTSTVGFGDVVAKTSLGRTFIMFFTLGSLILFANYIPEIVELFLTKKTYTSSYEVLKGKNGLILNPPAQVMLQKNTLGFFIAESPKHVKRSFLKEDSDYLDSSGMFYWCKATHLEKVILKRTDKSKLEFRNHIVACIFGDAHSTLMGLQNFVMPLRASNYPRQELKDIVFIGSLEYMQREWRFLRNFPQIYILPGSALYTADLHAVNIEECSMCAVLSSPPMASPQTLVDSQIIMATLNIGSLRMSCSARTPSEADDISPRLSESGKSWCRRIPILTELKNPSNIHFIEQLGGMEGHLSGTSLHLSTSFSTGSVFSGSFLDSLLATAFYNYNVLELLHMLVTGGISSQMEQYLDKEIVCRPSNSCFTLLSRRKRCKLGLLSLKQTILSDIKPKKTFGQVFCGLLNNFGILCLGLYRLIDDQEHNPEHKRGDHRKGVGRIDRSIPDQKEQTSFVPSSRSKNWKEKMFAILDRILTRIEDTQADTMESDKMWFVCHLEIISKNILDDLIFAKNLMVKCFSPYYEVFRNYLNMYHKALSTQIQELELEDLKANEIMSLFLWVLNTYSSTEREGNVELGLEVDMNALEILLSPNMVSELLHMYMSTLTSNIIAWLWKALETDRKDQVEETEPGADQTKKYKDEVQLYKEEHLRNWQDIKVIISNYQNPEGCSSLLEELLDLKQHLNEQKPKKWLLGSNAIDIICVTMEEYFNDFAKIKIPYKKRMMDPFVPYLEDLTLVSKSPDIRDDHVSMLLAMPGNASWNTKQTIIEGSKPTEYYRSQPVTPIIVWIHIRSSSKENDSSTAVTKIHEELAAFCRIYVVGHVLFLDFQDLFHSSLTSCDFCEVETPAFMAFMFNHLLEASAGSELCFKRNCQTTESGGSLESLLIKRKPLRLMFPSTPFDVKAGLGLFGKNVTAAFQLARVVSLNDQFQQHNYNQGPVTSRTIALVIKMMSGT
ncbi:Potassium channel subfamily U member 1 [Myotis brandtii]|uniref:Potassium channel subfamily U member 1 n=1 Tax=Myotis brandtii TaxID=109478 RepID=S7MD11_MYOBR|nr:Potassium channel subfamily U member 1 [Myotis brandtii]